MRPEEAALMSAAYLRAVLVFQWARGDGGAMGM